MRVGRLPGEDGKIAVARDQNLARDRRERGDELPAGARVVRVRDLRPRVVRQDRELNQA